MASAPETCYRHSDRQTRVHCTRCGRPICPDCMEPAPVGHHCSTCAQRREMMSFKDLPLPVAAAFQHVEQNVAVQVN